MAFQYTHLTNGFQERPSKNSPGVSRELGKDATRKRRMFPRSLIIVLVRETRKTKSNIAWMILITNAPCRDCAVNPFVTSCYFLYGLTMSLSKGFNIELVLNPKSGSYQMGRITIQGSIANTR